MVDDGDDASAMADVASLSQQPNQVKATKRPTKAPVAQSVAGTTQAPQPDDVVAANTAPARTGAEDARFSQSQRECCASKYRGREHIAGKHADYKYDTRSQFMPRSRPPMASGRWCGPWG